MEALAFGRYTVELSNTDKVLFPEDRLTKGDLVDYYRRIASTMLSHMRWRPVTMHRFPDGIGAEGFYQQEAPDYFPDWIRRATVDKEGGQVRHVVCDNAATLVYLANQACITPHIWLSRIDRPRCPDRMVFDLDPDGGTFDTVRDGANDLRELLGQLDLPSFVMTTGSRGLHLVVPLVRRHDFDEVRAFARDVAEVLARRHPSRYTTEQRRDARRGRLFFDTLRNSYAQTVVTPYAVRPLPGAPVATPLSWEELADKRLDAQRYTMTNLFRRLTRRSNPWEGFALRARALDLPRRQLDALLSELEQAS